MPLLDPDKGLYASIAREMLVKPKVIDNPRPLTGCWPESSR